MKINERSLITGIAINASAFFGRQESLNSRQLFDVSVYYVNFFGDRKHGLTVMERSNIYFYKRYLASYIYYQIISFCIPPKCNGYSNIKFMTGDYSTHAIS